MKKYILIVVTLFLIGCSTGKQIWLSQSGNESVKILYSNYSFQQMSIYLRKKIKFKNPNIRFANVKLNYFIEGEQIDGMYAYPMDYGKDGNLYRIGSAKGEKLYEINILPLSEREIIYELYIPMDYLKFEGIYKSLEHYLSLGKPIVYEDGLTGEKYKSSNSFIYEEPFSEFKRKNPELLEFLTKGDSIELEVISPVKQKYKFKAEW
ncbi:hypothetical protein ACI75Y_12935 [Capnocytophaga stomatis]|uniref:Uncharacterized protein n=1 Tax=Capnocytophaga stomatis TaxID=1848904 RepID=A0A250FYZ0_9FLAO|nr:hypothetical protein [Capnocytophaga stomatis]ATA90314.1 hypothetical protein CGC58_11580 [Capnocytophaga stomatis]GIM50967.1 hypothetical protein CAPN003_24190 [Capnocytophaga stomatis]